MKKPYEIVQFSESVKLIERESKMLKRPVQVVVFCFLMVGSVDAFAYRIEGGMSNFDASENARQAAKSGNKNEAGVSTKAEENHDRHLASISSDQSLDAQKAKVGVFERLFKIFK